MIHVDGRGERVTVVAFSGMAARNKVYEWLRGFEALPVNFVGVQDPARRWYQEGTLALGAALHDAILALASERLVFVGASAGGFAALLFGRMLNADRILAFSPQSACGEAKRQLGDRRWPELCQATPATDHADIAGDHPRADVHVAADDPLDRMHAGRLNPGRLVVHPAGGHDLALALKGSGALRRLLEEVIR